MDETSAEEVELVGPPMPIYKRFERIGKGKQGRGFIVELADGRLLKPTGPKTPPNPQKAQPGPKAGYTPEAGWGSLLLGGLC